jgi:hypothetical protein
MIGMLSNLLLFCAITLMLLAGAGLLHLLPRMGKAGKQLSEACCRVPLLDLIVCYFTVVPLLIGPLVSGWNGVLTALLSQVTMLLIWQWIHEAVHGEARRGPRIIKVLKQKFGTLRLLTAAYITALAIPVFWFVRLGELIIYPPLVWLINLPRYNSAEWITVSRQKFNRLIGHDLIWCLYCEWMTGVWCLASEMLRNVESLACPIRFSREKKCENCAIDFPDVTKAWVPASASMKEVAETLQRMYPSAEGPHPWFGHPLRKARLAGADRESAPARTHGQ